jgi:hypothetical protein
MTAVPESGFLIQACANCGAEHTISFDRGAQKSRTGPFALRPGDTLVVRIDGGQPVTAMWAAGAFPNFDDVTALQLAAVLALQLTGARIRDDAGGVLIESSTTGEKSRVQIIDGTASTELGFSTGSAVDPCDGRPVLGFVHGPGLEDANVIVLRRCNDCGANECLARTLDKAGTPYEGTHFQAHRKAVNALAQHAKARGWSHPALAARHAGETTEPPDIDRSFPSSPLEPARFLREPRMRTKV